MPNLKKFMLSLYPCLCVFALGQVASNLGRVADVDVIQSELVANKGIRGSRQIASMVTRRGERKLQAGGGIAVAFNLYDALRDIKVGPLTNGTVINLQSLGLTSPTELNVEAVVSGATPGSVKFILDVPSVHEKTENSGPYAMCGNSGSNYDACPKLTLGAHTVQAIPYSGSGLTGSILLASNNAVSFTIVNVPTNPVPVPVPVPVNPVPVPVPVPVIPVPVPVPVNPVPVPVPSPLPPTSCSIPKLDPKWESWNPYPLSIREGQGGMVGDTFFLVSGFSGSFSAVTKAVYGWNTTNPNATWVKFDDVPVPGFSHAARAVDGLLMYICGSYVGPDPGPDSDICLRFDPTMPSGSQWSQFQMPISRGGGGMVHDRATNTLVVATGATRRGNTVDFNTTYEYDLNTKNWIKRNDIPYKANHVSHVTATYQGKQRHYILGGQLGGNEGNGNQKDNYEWDAINKVWIRRADLVPARGHASSSTIAYGCGFLIIGGAINGGTKTSDISYYSIETDTWKSIGNLKSPRNTPVCDIVRLGTGGDWVYCEGTGRARISQS